MAPTEFESIIGPPVPGPWPPQLSVFEATQSLPETGPCVIAQQMHDDRRFSTSYTCSNSGVDDDAGLRALQASLLQCLNVSDWVEQQHPQGRGALSAQYGLIRLSITRNGETGGLALGVEAFRDERGEVMGSPTRGNRTEADGSQRCSPRSPEDISGFIAMYGARPGAERFENRQFIGYLNSVSAPAVAFVTRPSHPAHPAIIVRDITERNGSRFISASGDFAGDCEAFLALLREVDEMNRNVGH